MYETLRLFVQVDGLTRNPLPGTFMPFRVRLWEKAPTYGRSSSLYSALQSRRCSRGFVSENTAAILFLAAFLTGVRSEAAW